MDDFRQLPSHSISSTYSPITQLCMGRLDILAVVCDLSKLGKHLCFRDADVIKTSKTIVCCGITSHGFRTNIPNRNSRKDLVIVSGSSEFSTQEKEPSVNKNIPIDLSWTKNRCGP